MALEIRAEYGDFSPVAAVATAAGPGALALVRVSGEGALELFQAAFSRPKALGRAPGNTVVYGWIVDPKTGVRIDEVLVSVYRAPRSFTGEDGADISCHGGGVTSRAVLEALLAAGFREALAGEFCFRAFINGKIDLTRAESVAEIIGARSERARGNAVLRLEGALEKRIRAVKDALTLALAELELNLDYSELDGVGEEGSGLPARERLEAALSDLTSLLRGYMSEKLYREGVSVVLAGPANAGKSSLFNALLREERAIVTPAAGTTRDYLDGWIALDGVPVRLIDTAGLRDGDSEAERLGIERSRALIEEADAVLFLVDGAAGRSGALERLPAVDENRLILLWNKSDIAGPPVDKRFLAVSAVTGEGVEKLLARLKEVIERAGAKSAPDGGGGIGGDRQKRLVERAASSLENALALDGTGAPLDIIAPELRDAACALGEITGENACEDIVAAMFSRFCVGK
ncbi:MAG: tRNA uridine-5-carboxymethylaminomethyl(34) synthesis GTPase MnmE [Spirochaetaceae bacterium]|jgi:tRNA modification GTPase|nr:tRNA uridine-5-carboxymethylaminomethyl(34) synthesis GTPase MnmE [Spirochaetaceae bacterium]